MGMAHPIGLTMVTRTRLEPRATRIAGDLLVCLSRMTSVWLCSNAPLERSASQDRRRPVGGRGRSRSPP